MLTNSRHTFVVADGTGCHDWESWCWAGHAAAWDRLRLLPEVLQRRPPPPSIARRERRSARSSRGGRSDARAAVAALAAWAFLSS